MKSSCSSHGAQGEQTPKAKVSATKLALLFPFLEFLSLSRACPQPGSNTLDCLSRELTPRQPPSQGIGSHWGPPLWGASCQPPLLAEEADAFVARAPGSLLRPLLPLFPSGPEARLRE